MFWRFLILSYAIILGRGRVYIFMRIRVQTVQLAFHGHRYSTIYGRYLERMWD